MTRLAATWSATDGTAWWVWVKRLMRATLITAPTHCMVGNHGVAESPQWAMDLKLPLGLAQAES